MLTVWRAKAATTQGGIYVVEKTVKNGQKKYSKSGRRKEATKIIAAFQQNLD